MHRCGTKEPLYFHHYYATMIWRQSHPNVWFLSYCWHQISPSSSFVPLFYDWCEIKRHPSSKMMMLGEEGSKLDISIWSLLFCRSLAREMTLRLAVGEFSELRIFPPSGRGQDLRALSLRLCCCCSRQKVHQIRRHHQQNSPSFAKLS